MKVNKNFLVGLFLTWLVPVLGFSYTILKINKKNQSAMLLNIFFFVFLVTLNLQPYQDLYRRYLETYHYYNSNTTFLQAISGHVDITFYILTLAAKKVGIPFPFLVAFMSATSMYLFIKSALTGVTDSTKDNVVRFSVIICFLLHPTISLALGIRWGFSISILLYGYFCLYSRGHLFSGVLVIIISILTHFSMMIIVPVLISSSFIKLNRISFIVLSATASVVSALILPMILSSIGDVGSYASNGYGSENDVNGVGNLNSIIATAASFVYTALFTILILSKWKHCDDSHYQKLRNLTLMLFVFSCLSAVSFVAFRRYTNTLFYFFAVCTYLHYCLLKNETKRTVVFVSLIAFVFSGMYLQRRPLILGEVWKGLYTPAVMYVLLNNTVYDGYLIKIDSDGDWKGNKINK